MLDDMPKSHSAALVARPEDALSPHVPRTKKLAKKVLAAADLTTAEARPKRGWRREKVVKQSALGMLLQPIGVSLALVLSAYALLSLGTTFYRSYQSHLDHTGPVHADKSILDIFFGDQSLPPDAVDLVVKDVDGSLHKVVASKSETDKFVNDTILMLDDERARIKQAAHEDLDRSFALAFQDREPSIGAYADWFFEWKRSYVVLKESITSAITRFFEAGKYESLTEAVEADVKDYFLTNYKEQVLKPELRDPVITQGVEQAVRHAHDSYRRVIANGDMRLQLFLAKHTSHLEDLPASTPATSVKLDWDAQKWKAPVYLMQDRAFDGIAGIGGCRRRHRGRARAWTSAQQRAGAKLRAAVAALRHLARDPACACRAGGGRGHLRAAHGRTSDRCCHRRGDRCGCRLPQQRGKRSLQPRRLRGGQQPGAGRHHRRLEVEPGGQHGYGHRQMVRRRKIERRARRQIAVCLPPKAERLRGWMTRSRP